ncbi:MAG: hypothetical protein AMJ88_13510 [Anaerolineae bacterium SM23_ 63]|nr:MAG: hypothetical protein AMJ88_13510 [Anaerolineae bacterium SM23_ 63]
MVDQSAYEVGSTRRVITLFFGDTHGGHKLGLLNPLVTLFDLDERGNRVPYHPELTSVQRYLWSCFQEDLGEVEEIADGDEIIVIHVGDLGHGTKYTEQLVSTRPADQVLIAVGNMEPTLNLPNVKRMRIIHGTQAHTFGESTIPIITAGFLDAKYSNVDVSSLAHGLFEVDGLEIDCAHHGPSPGIRTWTTGNRLRLYVRSVMQDSLENGEDPPGVFIRSHYHTGIHETVRRETNRGHFKTEAFILPSYCGLSEYAQQATRSKYLISNGMLALVIEGGELVEYYKLWRSVDLRTRESL